jgi:hypothetical protein
MFSRLPPRRFGGDPGLEPVACFGFRCVTGGVQLLESHAWNPRLGSAFSLGVDGISLPLVWLAALLAFIAVLASGAIRERVKGYYLLLLLLEAPCSACLRARLVAVLCVLGTDPAAALLPHRPLGRRRAAAGGAELRALHHGRLGVHADRPAHAV